MGYSLTWIAVRDVPAKAVCERLDLVETAQLDEIPDSSKKYGVTMPDNWYVVVVDDRSCVAADMEQRIPNLFSDVSEVVVFETSDTVMFTTISDWKFGRRAWHVVHDPDARDDIYDLRADGDVPHQFEAIRRKVIEHQESEGGREADVDWVYEAPKLLGEALTGYNHSPDPEGPEPATPLRIHELAPSKTLGNGGRFLLAAARSFGLESAALRKLGLEPARMIWW